VAFNDIINDVTEIYELATGHTALQLRKKKFFSVKYMRHYIAQSLGCFLCHPVL